VGNSVTLSFTPGALRIEPYSGFALDSNSSSTSVTAGDSPYRAQLTRTYHVADALKNALESMRESIGSGKKTSTAARASSTADIGMDELKSATVMRSTEEVNATPSSFTPFESGFSKGVSATATVLGEYTGNGDDRFKVVARTTGTVGEDWIYMRVKDDRNRTVDTFWLSPSYEPGTPVETADGLQLAINEGNLKKGSKFWIDAYENVGSAVNPDGAFDEIGSDRPNFEWGTSVTAGSFDVNGTTIAVNADDTLNAVLDRINASDAGVVASFDQGTESVVLTRTDLGSEYDITVDNDSSGFLAASKLDTAVAELGRDGGWTEIIGTVPELNHIESGTAYVNGEAISVDILSDSLEDVIDRINTADAGVVASISEDGERIQMLATQRGGSIELDDGDTQLFSELNLEVGEHRGRTRQGLDDEAMMEAMGELKRAMNAMFRDRAGESGVSAVVTGLRTSLRSAVGDAFDSEGGERLRSGFGVDFDFRDQAFETMDYSRGRLRSALATRPSEVLEFFADDDDGSAGMLSKMISKLSGSMEAIEDTLGHVGLNVDVAL